jgi:hypothetical protein
MSRGQEQIIGYVKQLALLCREMNGDLSVGIASRMLVVSSCLNDILTAQLIKHKPDVFGSQSMKMPDRIR